MFSQTGLLAKMLKSPPGEADAVQQTSQATGGDFSGPDAQVQQVHLRWS